MNATRRSSRPVVQAKTGELSPAACALRDELLRRSRGPHENTAIQMTAAAFDRLLEQARFTRFASKADNSPSAVMLRQVIVVASAMNALGYTHNAAPQPELPKLVVRQTTLEELARERSSQQQPKG